MRLQSNFRPSGDLRDLASGIGPAPAPANGASRRLSAALPPGGALTRAALPPGGALTRAALFATPLLALLALLPSCGGSSTATAGSVDGGLGGSGSLSIVACSLGCSPSSGGGPISCAINSIYVNQELAVEFDKPIAPASVNPLSFRVVSETGSTPSGEYLVDPSNPRRVLFRPLVTFGSDGLPKFGFSPSLSYTIEVPAAAPGALGFFITAVDGQKNVTPLKCSVVPSLSVQDVVVGPPVVKATIEELTAAGAVFDAFSSPDSVPLNARLRFEFDDVMNPATLLNTVTSTSDFIQVQVDLDGDLSDASDQLEVLGSFEIEIVQSLALKRTTVIFTPEAGFPSAGSDGDEPRRIVVSLPPTITDLGGNNLANAGTLSFTTQPGTATQEVLAATFAQGDETLDLARSSVVHDPLYEALSGGGEVLFTGRLLRGLGGGSGRLGDLLIPSGTELVLSTGPAIPTRFGPALTNGAVFEDGQLVAYDVAAQIVDGGAYPADWADNGIDGDGPGQTVATVVDGVFEFASLTIEPGARLRLVGERGARIFVRGDADIRGGVFAHGSAALDHDALVGFGGAGGSGGPGGGAGGDGGDRALVSAEFVAKGGYPHAFGSEVIVDGAVGGGRGGAQPSGADDFGAGTGGRHFPELLPGPTSTELGDFEANKTCATTQVGTPGGGGTFALAGGAPTYATPMPFDGVPVGPLLESPSASLAPVGVVQLDPDAGGSLAGGAGGGGGGMGIALSQLAAQPVTCLPIPGFDLFISIYRDASGAGGGGGGGAMQLQVGHRLDLRGVLAFAGGDGGSADGGVTTDAARTAAPGGGGSGGALLLQAFDLELAGFPGLLDVQGGEGGRNDFSGSLGGAGAPGILRLENSAWLAGALPAGVASAEPLELDEVAGSVLPFLGTEPSDPVPLDQVLALGDFAPVSAGPGATVGAQSCWLLPSPGTFETEYAGDGPGPDDLGWDLILELSGDLGGTAGQIVSYRGDPGPLGVLTGGVSLAEFLGNELATSDCGCSGSAIVVRFQGARLLGAADSPCAIDLGAAGPLLAGSLTPWLASPEELWTYWDSVLGVDSGLAAGRRPNMLRAQVLIDGDDPLAAMLGSIVELSVTVLAD
ncbi:Ig-like domain-containing protein [Engelhardtia mirabilis]|uniref:Uncharacterized protein n=1 Tax=Engelhardtia mirabilis TaxID=2528011 RepID=A0A518BPB3_9BACT|nr:hypothetical protein Pla133_38760 [Planctomycetes bacterium Pla133]QDV03100.1 hypothetical protein Pla86_38750 [Planctomycetes bacterium Pla86]